MESGVDADEVLSVTSPVSVMGLQGEAVDLVEWNRRLEDLERNVLELLVLQRRLANQARREERKRTWGNFLSKVAIAIVCGVVKRAFVKRRED
eukprot:CAMPEP_0198328658 /NCGR_PEP_ID=MMETSP1450-20131203/15608_1 /TAXON_ID=753684 ORGANISM="Madagascaria erythrocladiodes, Strain CCMP3234" /NCGR_SAMPLE_ID=MMETSP1450 /ASSEMBLY_ACC=CAM_ASM_001115 /LENGTH=92 /DNA_ID=CAMNT_0044032805 /DNA_START=149 /DNA_END=427 /DNA_ORIENTATION=+